MSAVIALRHNNFALHKTYCTVPNVSYGGFRWGEADMIAATKAFYLTEGEIKVSYADFKADFRKKKYKEGTRQNKAWLKDIKRHYFIVPEELKDKCLEYLEKKDSDSGLIFVGVNKYDSYYCRTVREARINKKAQKLDRDRLLKICRLLCYRFWNEEYRK